MHEKLERLGWVGQLGWHVVLHFWQSTKAAALADRFSIGYSQREDKSDNTERSFMRPIDTAVYAGCDG